MQKIVIVAQEMGPNEKMLALIELLFPKCSIEVVFKGEAFGENPALPVDHFPRRST